jgi:hypothetical protein
MSTNLRQNLIQIALEWQRLYGVAPDIVKAISEYDAAKMVGMSDDEYSTCMQDKTAVCRGHDFVYKGTYYQIKARRPSGKPGSVITNAGKATNYNWDKLIWIRYNVEYEIQEAWSWDREKYVEAFDRIDRISPTDMRKGQRLA